MLNNNYNKFPLYLKYTLKSILLKIFHKDLIFVSHLSQIKNDL
jgi:hypothetical protein